jgi:hypothetical protein
LGFKLSVERIFSSSVCAGNEFKSAGFNYWALFVVNTCMYIEKIMLNLTRHVATDPKPQQRQA